jgi:hypothetical protein
MTHWLSQFLTAFSKPLKWWVVVAPWEQGIKVRLGKTAIQLTPGIHFRIPFLDRIYVQSIRLRTITKDNQTVSTKDGKVISISVAIQFAIIDIVKLYNSVANPELTLRNLVLSKISEYISNNNIIDVSPVHIEKKVNSEIEEFEDWGLGDLSCFVVGFACTKTYRLLMNDYANGGGLYDIEDEDGSGEK